jgi:GTPase SAR1 family protein
MEYCGKDLVIICFSVAAPESLEHVETVWVPEVRHHCPGVPILLVGLQRDKEASGTMREGERPVERSSGKHVSDKIKASGYLECSARAGRGVDEVFREAAKLALEQGRCAGA